MWLVAAVLIELAVALGAYTECYSAELGLNNDWEISLTFDSLPKGWVAATRAMPGYYRAQIAFDTTSLRESLDMVEPGERDAVLRQVVLHELWHVMVWEIGELAGKANPLYAHRLEEQLLTRIERLPFWQTLCQEEFAPWRP